MWFAAQGADPFQNSLKFDAFHHTLFICQEPVCMFSCKQLLGLEKEHNERERLLDYFEGINLEHDIKGYFDSESLSQIPPMYINLVRNITQCPHIRITLVEEFGHQVDTTKC